MRYRIIILILIIASCKSETKAPVPQATGPVNESGLEPLPVDEIIFLFNEATYVDYIFHDLPFSLSQSDVKAVQANVGMISSGTPYNFKNNCKSMGREFFHVNGEIVWEAELYFDPENKCSAYIFYKNKKPVYANAISDAGIKFYTNLLNQNLGLPNAKQ